MTNDIIMNKNNMQIIYNVINSWRDEQKKKTA